MAGLEGVHFTTQNTLNERELAPLTKQKLTPKEGDIPRIVLSHIRVDTKESDHEGVEEGGVWGRSKDGSLFSRGSMTFVRDPVETKPEQENAVKYGSKSVRIYSNRKKILMCMSDRKIFWKVAKFGQC